MSLLKMSKILNCVYSFDSDAHIFKSTLLHLERPRTNHSLLSLELLVDTKKAKQSMRCFRGYRLRQS